MSTTRVAPGAPGPARSKRVRHQARDAVVLMAFSAGASVGLAGLLFILAALAQRG
ncbi:hypothetical protein [Nocardioides insulae]|uniref:hypothetical protein n=1 Tax=Nocardioides insulae TaxID=394734 RepID=UPI0012F7AA7A|nr:hypothetical protein [Nocardioides insulae]